MLTDGGGGGGGDSGGDGGGDGGGGFHVRCKHARQAQAQAQAPGRGQEWACVRTYVVRSTRAPGTVLTTTAATTTTITDRCRAVPTHTTPGRLMPSLPRPPSPPPVSRVQHQRDSYSAHQSATFANSTVMQHARATAQVRLALSWSSRRESFGTQRAPPPPGPAGFSGSAAETHRPAPERCGACAGGVGIIRSPSNSVEVGVVVPIGGAVERTEMQVLSDIDAGRCQPSRCARLREFQMANR
ncbi:hypothetical protein EDC01DRAFT_442038 [Geopyxis carbonaria]|nr:hypothetical protein EDC01DRAFT_442038 [Geopyxis carbonaria]